MRVRLVISLGALLVVAAASAADTGSTDSGSTDTAVYDTGGHGASYLAQDPGGCGCANSGGASGLSAGALAVAFVLGRRRRA